MDAFRRSSGGVRTNFDAPEASLLRSLIEQVMSLLDEASDDRTDPAFEPDACIALPSASIAVMGPQAAVNAVFYNQIQAIEDEAERERKVVELREEYARDIDLLHLASELVIDAVVQPEDLRDDLVRRFALAAGRHRGRPESPRPAKRNPVTPV